MDKLPKKCEWPEFVEVKYERVAVLGKGSFGMVFMSRRVTDPEDDLDEEYVAIKNILIKNEKGKVYAEREIRILQELKHPNVIRLVKSYPEYDGTRVVVMQLARGPNLHQLVVKRGALGLPLCRLVSRQLIAAVSYIHGRAVIHRDIKPSNCILARQNIPITEEYDWLEDHSIWSNGPDGEEAVRTNKWKVMLVDFGFARALEMEEISSQKTPMRNSIVFEANKEIRRRSKKEQSTRKLMKAQSKSTISIQEEGDSDSDSIAFDLEQLDKMASKAAKSLRKSCYEPISIDEDVIMGKSVRERQSGVSMMIPEPIDTQFTCNDSKSSLGSGNRISQRISTARHKIRSMSALGTKAYAAPEIRKKLRQKNDQDIFKANAALTECVADYGMIVDAYSVGWTLRVTMTGVPPNFTISEYMEERDCVVLDGEEDIRPGSGSCCCSAPASVTAIKIRDPRMLPASATLLLTKMTEKRPESRMTVREAQSHPYIMGEPGDIPFSPPQGDYPSLHGDPVVPLSCAEELSNFTVEYHLK